MKYPFILVMLCFINLSCSGGSDDFPETKSNVPVVIDTSLDWIVDKGLINGSDNPFPLAKDPIMYEARNTDFIADDIRVAAVSFDGEIKIYPYSYLNSFESVNDEINDKSYALTYCPLTQSALLVNREYRNDDFVIRASGYLLHDNVILKDQASDTYWSQMMGQCIKGSYAREFIGTYNFVEMTWKTVRENFPNAKVFTNASISSFQQSGTANKAEIEKGDLVYGIIAGSSSQQLIGSEKGKSAKVFMYHYDDFESKTILKTEFIGSKNMLIIGNKNDSYITSYINDSNASFEAIQNRFPIVMIDENNNEWNVFGQAVSGPRKGEQLDSQVGFFALFSAWEDFYDEFTFD